MTPRDLIDDLRSRINPAYAATIGTESYERRLCAEALEAQADELNRLLEEVAEMAELCNRQADLLSRTAIALRGPEPPLTRWSWHDLPERAAAAIAAIDVMQRAAVMAAEGNTPNAEITGSFSSPG